MDRFLKPSNELQVTWQWLVVRELFLNWKGLIVYSWRLWHSYRPTDISMSSLSSSSKATLLAAILFYWITMKAVRQLTGLTRTGPMNWPIRPVDYWTLPYSVNWGIIDATFCIWQQNRHKEVLYFANIASWMSSSSFLIESTASSNLTVTLSPVSRRTITISPLLTSRGPSSIRTGTPWHAKNLI